MNLKNSYLAFLLSLVALFAVFIYGLLFFLQEKQYFLAILLVLALYVTMYFLGKQISITFLQLIALKHIKNCDGIITSEDLLIFLKQNYRRKISADALDAMAKQITQNLQERNLVELDEKGNVRLVQNQHQTQ